MTTERIRCMVVDDAALMRATIRQMIETDPDIEVIDTAGSGPVALEKIKALRPDVITLDVEMPGMDGITLLRRIMEESPTSVVMLSTFTQHGAQRTLDALEAGAVDYVGKPTGQEGHTLRDVTSSLIAKIKAAATANLDPLRTRLSTRPPVRPAPVCPTPVSPAPTDRDHEVLLAVGISAGGPATLVDIFTQLPAETPPILITQHMPSGFTKSFADRLDRLSSIAVKEAQAGDIVRPNQALIAPGDGSACEFPEIASHQGPNAVSTPQLATANLRDATKARQLSLARLTPHSTSPGRVVCRTWLFCGFCANANT